MCFIHRCCCRDVRSGTSTPRRKQTHEIVEVDDAITRDVRLAGLGAPTDGQRPRPIARSACQEVVVAGRNADRVLGEFRWKREAAARSVAEVVHVDVTRAARLMQVRVESAGRVVAEEVVLQTIVDEAPPDMSKLGCDFVPKRIGTAAGR